MIKLRHILIIYYCISLNAIIAQTKTIAQIETKLYLKDSIHWNIKQLDTARDSMYLTEIEKNVVLEMNMVRSNPKQYGELYIKPKLSKFDGMQFDLGDNHWLLTNEGTKAVVECIKVLNEAKPCDLVYPNKKLRTMSKYHADLQGETEQTGHDTPAGETLNQRIKRLKIPYYCYAENIIYGHNSARDIVVGFLVDDGVPSRGHRITIINNFYNKIGVYFGVHKKYKCMCVIDFVGYKNE